MWVLVSHESRIWDALRMVDQKNGDKYKAASWIALMLLSDPTLYAMMQVPAMLLFAQAWGRVACPAVTRECDSGVFFTFSRTRADAFTALFLGETRSTKKIAKHGGTRTSHNPHDSNGDKSEERYRSLGY